MRVVVSQEQRFARDPDGRVWTPGEGAYTFWTRYLEVFGAVRVVARVQDVQAALPGWRRADGEGVSFAAVPYYRGPWQYLRHRRGVKGAAAQAVGPEDAVILRVPSQIGSCIAAALRSTRHPYAVEVIGDPYDVFAPGAVRHPLRPFLRWLSPRRLRQRCAEACAAAYVTQSALQCRYPCSSYSTACSDVEIPDDWWAGAPRPVQPDRTAFRLVFVGSLEQPYKGLDVLLDAVAACVGSGLDLTLSVLGDGGYRPQLEARAAAAGIGGWVTFHGHLPAREAVARHLRKADLFVLPSRTEGLPRAMIEAMAFGLPCIGSAVGGIPDLLPPEDLVRPGDALELATRLREVLSDPQRLAKMSGRNLAHARDYRGDVLRERRLDFYRRVRDCTAAWVAGRQGRPRLLHITTVPQTLSFLSGQSGHMKQQGFEIHALSSPGERLDRFAQREGVPVHPVAMARRITPLKDLVAVWRIARVMGRVRPDLVHGHTPKGGLLGMIAATCRRVPVRIYHIHGLRFMTASGWRRRLLCWTEWLSCRLAHAVLCDSHSIREVAVAERLCPAAKVRVLLSGSVNGVDADGRFDPARVPAEAGPTFRQQHGIPAHAPTLAYIGRIVRDKGLIELADAWQRLRDVFPDLHLAVAGRFETQDPVPAHVEELLRTDPRIHLAGHVPDVLQMYAAADVVVLPTYREGLPVVPLEAAAMAVPVVATRIPGCVDAVQDGVTGALVPVHDAAALADAIAAYVRDPELRRRHGRAARERVLRDFRPAAMWEALRQEYSCLLQRRVRSEARRSAWPGLGPRSPGEPDRGFQDSGSATPADAHGELSLIRD
jgi:glycosyltransferase involved in cell wall biosynthesis